MEAPWRSESQRSPAGQPAARGNPQGLQDGLVARNRHDRRPGVDAFLLKYGANVPPICSGWAGITSSGIFAPSTRLDLDAALADRRQRVCRERTS